MDSWFPFIVGIWLLLIPPLIVNATYSAVIEERAESLEFSEFDLEQYNSSTSETGVLGIWHDVKEIYDNSRGMNMLPTTVQVIYYISAFGLISYGLLKLLPSWLSG